MNLDCLVKSRRKENTSRSDEIFETSLWWLTFASFVLLCTILFVYLNRIHPYLFIDEVFHIPQTLYYCAGNFSEWNQKITTPPGLYFVTAAFLGPLNLCHRISIRATNLILTFINFHLVYKIVSLLSSTEKSWMNLIISYNIILFPPLFSFFFLYYTDFLSLTFILAMYLLHLNKRKNLSAFTGFLSICVRQTNIIWILLLAFDHGLDILEEKTKKSLTENSRYSSRQVKWFLKIIVAEIQRGPLSFIKFSSEILVALSFHITVGIIFLAFIVWNGGIVIGDRTAHIPTIHIPQLLYFFSFTLCFAWPFMLPLLRTFLHDVFQHWIISSCIFCLMTIVIHSNTLVHPYVLADNRHYVFYAWHYFMIRYSFFKYLLIPLHSFSAYAFFNNLSHVRFLSRVAFLICISTVLIPQLLLEPRYFIVPYILFRLNIKEFNLLQIILESFTVFTINFVHFYIFVNKVFYWSDQKDPQRISW